MNTDPQDGTMHHMNTIAPLLTKADVCEILGVKETWLNPEISAGKIPHIRLGKRKNIRFRPEHIEEYLKNKEQETPKGQTHDGQASVD